MKCIIHFDTDDDKFVLYIGATDIVIHWNANVVILAQLS